MLCSIDVMHQLLMHGIQNKITPKLLPELEQLQRAVILKEVCCTLHCTPKQSHVFAGTRVSLCQNKEKQRIIEMLETC